MTPFQDPGDQSRTVTPQFFSDLEMSGDGKILYALVESGTGRGEQPGRVVPINVDLYNDVRPSDAGLQSDLTQYLKRGRPTGVPRFYQMDGVGLTQRGFTTGDEPKEVAVFYSTALPLATQHAYVVHGGAKEFLGVSPSLAAFNNLVALAEIEINGFKPPRAVSPIAALPGALSSLLSSGITILNAPGLVGVFELNNVIPSQVFPSSVAFAWDRPSIPGDPTPPMPRPGERVYAKRPYSIALTGGMGLLGFYQTGNFGILTRFSAPGHGPIQSLFNNPVQQATFASLPAHMYQGIAAVTPSIELDNHLWPDRGRLRTFGPTVPSPDEARLFTYDVEIDSNRRCALASHGDMRSA
jgi:hypothetical protein